MSLSCMEEELICGNLEYTRIENEMIIGFNLWGEKRLCLPQLLRFVLNDFDIDTIDGAVTNLQIKCFPCSPEQMRMLNETNIFPSKILRCGLIRKSDAERLCKYILQPNQMVNSLLQPEDLRKYPSIEVIHMCFGQQTGVLYPVLYVSSDAKCIKCSTCENLFRTYEFVGHTHKLDEVSNTSHWGFDSTNWRLLIHLTSQKSGGPSLNKCKVILDRIKLLFYEDELNQNGKFIKTVLWRPRKKIKLPQPRLSVKNIPVHLNNQPVEVYRKSSSNVQSTRNLFSFNASAISFNHPPNVYLKPPPGTGNDTEASMDDDDIDELDEVVTTSNNTNNNSNSHRSSSISNNSNLLSSNAELVKQDSNKLSNDPALNAALQIKRDLLPRDLISLGAVSLFIQQNIPSAINATTNIGGRNNNNNNNSNNNHSTNTSIGTGTGAIDDCDSGMMVAQPSTSVPTQYLMVEAVWSQLVRETLQLAQLVHCNSPEEKTKFSNQLFRCQDVLRTHWTSMIEQNTKLSETLSAEQRQRKEIEEMYDKLVIRLNKMRKENERLSQLVTEQNKVPTFQQHINHQKKRQEEWSHSLMTQNLHNKRRRISGEPSAPVVTRVEVISPSSSTDSMGTEDVPNNNTGHKLLLNSSAGKRIKAADEAGSVVCEDQKQKNFNQKRQSVAGTNNLCDNNNKSNNNMNNNSSSSNYIIINSRKLEKKLKNTSESSSSSTLSQKL